ncbi:MAG: MarR family transcriptional regulator [Acidobacteriota bacterium]|nr:MarR family transcriptional regulator [Acidobacteriota bacterium]
MARRPARGIETLTNDLRAAFYTGEIATGGRVLSVREIARRMGISPTTALALVHRLEAEGMIESRLRSGTFLRRVGLEKGRDARELSLFKLALQTSKRLSLINTSGEAFSELLMRCSGEVVRTDFVFGIVMHGEAFGSAVSLVRHRLPNAPCIRLSPDASDDTKVRNTLQADRSMKCLLATYLYANRALQLARDFGRYMVVIRPDPGSFGRLIPNPGLKRYLLTRDRQTANDVRNLVRTLFDDEAASRLIVAALEAEDAEDATAFQEIEREAEVVSATPGCFKEVSQRYAGCLSVEMAPANLGEGTVEEMLYHYLFA